MSSAPPRPGHLRGLLGPSWGHLRRAAAHRPPAPAVEASPGTTAQEKPQRRRWFHYTLPGAWVALVFVCLSFTPSLLPRNGLLQALLCAINGAIGYGLGVAGAWVWREFADRDARRPRPGAWRAFAVAAGITLPLSFALGLRWQEQIRDLMGVAADGVLWYVLLPFVTAVLLVVFIAVGRGLRRAYRRLVRLLDRWIGPRAARAVGWLAVAVATFTLVTGVLADGLLKAADRSFALADLTTPSGVEPPTTSLRSGGPGSVMSWDSLGREGRKFVGRGPTTESISAYAGSAAEEPIRVFAGYAAAEDVEDRAALAVRDLARAGGFGREYLLVVTTTGSGWVEPSAVDSFEYLTGGDSAIVAMQYSHLPSWLSYLVDQERAREAGRELFDAVFSRWSRLPRDERPQLIVFGESLGSFGGETAFSGARDLANRTDGALFVGPPSFNTLHEEFTDDREAGSSQAEPVYRGGRIVRFDDGDAEMPPERPWRGPRVLYLQYPSDPIVWWNPRLAFDKPGWLGERRGHDVLDEMMWIPVVTFWQVSADLPFAIEVPAGHGHKYSGHHGDAWATVLKLGDWSAADSERLDSFMTSE